MSSDIISFEEKVADRAVKEIFNLFEKAIDTAIPESRRQFIKLKFNSVVWGKFERYFRDIFLELGGVGLSYHERMLRSFEGAGRMAASYGIDKLDVIYRFVEAELIKNNEKREGELPKEGEEIGPPTILSEKRAEII